MPLKNDLYKLYWDDKLTQKEIGERYNKSPCWVSQQMKYHQIPTRETIDIKGRFLYYVKIPLNPNDCWEWIGFRSPLGYGRFKLNGIILLAHRISYILFNGEIDSALCCLHKCDNPGCVNPNHLFLGTREDNVKDARQKGRSCYAIGEKNGRVKLIEYKVKEIKALLLQGKSQADIAKNFGVSQSTVSSIKQGRNWKYILRKEMS